MTVKDTLISMLVKYPMLFENKWKCYEHLFSHYGNGYDWHNGELVELIFAKRGKDENGYPRRIEPTLKKLGIRKRDIPQRVYAEMEDFTPIFHTWMPDRLPELRKIFAEKFYDTHSSNNTLFENFFKGMTKEEFVEKAVKAEPKQQSLLIRGDGKPPYTIKEYMEIRQCKKFSYVYNYPEDMKEDWAIARQEWEDYLKSIDCFLN